MDGNTIAYLIGMGVCLVAGLVLYGTRRLSSEQINSITASRSDMASFLNLRSRITRPSIAA